MSAAQSIPSSTSVAVPQTMRAIRIVAAGHAYDSTIEISSEIAVPTVSADEVLIRVHAAGMNPGDWKVAEGNRIVMAFLHKSFPYIAGFDYAGEIVQLGSNVHEFTVGDRVHGHISNSRQYGCMAEYVKAAPWQVCHFPNSLSFASAAALPCSMLCAHQALFHAGNLRSQPSPARVLVIGGGSAIGLAAVQLAKASGAYVAATASSGSGSAEMVKMLGADQVVEYDKEKWWEVLKSEGKEEKKFSIIIDVVGEPSSWDYAQPLFRSSVRGFPAPQFIHVNNPDVAGGGFKLMRFVGALAGRWLHSSLSSAPHYRLFIIDSSQKAGMNEQLTEVNQWIQQGKVKPTVAEVFEFNKKAIVEMFNRAASGKSRGKLVLQILPDGINTPILSQQKSSSASSSSSSS